MARRSGGGKGAKYESLSDSVARTGEYELALPLDRMILEILPDQGTTFGGFYEIGETVQEIRKKLDIPDTISSTLLGSRLRSLQIQGLAHRIKGLGAQTGSYAWQRTPAANEYLAKEGNSGGS